MQQRRPLGIPTSPSTTQHGQQGSGQDLRSQLRGMSFDEGEQLLSPRGGSSPPVQRLETDESDKESDNESDKNSHIESDKESDKENERDDEIDEVRTVRYQRWRNGPIELLELSGGQSPEDWLVQVDEDEHGIIWGPDPRLLLEDDEDDKNYVPSEDEDEEIDNEEIDNEEVEEGDLENQDKRKREDHDDDERDDVKCPREGDPPISYYQQFLDLDLDESDLDEKREEDEERDLEEVMKERDTVKGLRDVGNEVEILRERFEDRRNDEEGIRTFEVNGNVVPKKTTGRLGAPEPENGFICSTSKSKEKEKKKKEDEEEIEDEEESEETSRNERNSGRYDVEKGHILALQNGGPDIPENIVPQWAKWQGSGIWRRHERYALEKHKELAKKTKGHGLKLRIRPYYKARAKSIGTFNSKTFPGYFSFELIEVDENGKVVEGGFKETYWLYAHQNVTDDKLSLRISKNLDDELLDEEGEEKDDDEEKDHDEEDEEDGDDEKEVVKTSSKKGKKGKKSGKGKKSSGKRPLFDQVEIPGIGICRLNDVPGDGDCAYHSGRGASGDNRSIQQLRDDTADSVQRTYPNLPPRYIARLRRRGTWAVDLHLEHLARVLDVTMHVHTIGNDGRHMQSNTFGNGSNVIHLAHTGYNHYQILILPNMQRVEIPVEERIETEDEEEKESTEKKDEEKESTEKKDEEKEGDDEE